MCRNKLVRCTCNKCGKVILLRVKSRLFDQRGVNGLKKLLLFLLVIVTIITCTAPLYASKLEEYQQAGVNTTSDISKTQSAIKKAEEAKALLKQAQEQLKMNEEEQRRVYAQIETDLAAITEKIKAVENEFAVSEEEYKTQVEKLKQRLRVMYEYSTVSILDILFESKSILDFFQRIEVITSVAEENDRLIEEINVLKNDIEFKKTMREEELAYFEGEATAQIDRINLILSDRNEVTTELEYQETYINKLEKDLDNLMEESKKITQMIKELRSRMTYAGGTMAWPLPSDYNVHSGFGSRLHPILKTYKMHTGVDIGGKYGASIVAANNGTVISAGWRSGYGYCVIIDHGVFDGKTITSLYAHCSKINVKVGQTVKKGQIIANVGSTGLSTGPHLHFEIRENGDPVNPINGKYLIKN